MNTLLRINDTIESVVVMVGRIAAWTSILLMFVILFDVITRRFFVLGSTKLQELEWHIHAVLFLFCLGYCYLKDAHVRIDLVRERLSDRTKLWIELIGCLLFFIPYAYLVIYHGIDWWYRSFSINETAASATGLPYRWIIKIALPIGFTLLLISGVSTAIRKLLELFGPLEMRERLLAREEREAIHLDEVDRLD